MRWVFLIVGILFVLLGAVWVLQGTNVLTGSSVMSGQSLWTVIGAILAAVGVVLVVLGATRRGTKSA